MTRFALSLAAAALLATAAVAQEPAPVWPSPLPISAGQPPAAVVPSGLPERPPEAPVPEPRCEAPGQQHWVSLNLSVLQPFVGRVGVKVWRRPNDSIWVEGYGGSVLFDVMYGFGVRLQHTARTNSKGDALMLAPGLGVHVIPDWYYYTREYDGSRRHHSSLTYVALDMDISWLHDFIPHCGYEIGVKVGIAVRTSGTVGSDYPKFAMFGPDVYPLFNVYSGLRF